MLKVILRYIGFITASVIFNIWTSSRQVWTSFGKIEQFQTSYLQCFSAHRDVEGDIKVGFITASVIFNISNGGNGQDVPLDRHVELGEINTYN